MVDHEELFRDTGTLPNFNSHAIGARLHHIEGLSEQYLYFNDDSFIGRPVPPDLFFQSNGCSKFFLSRSTLPFRRAMGSLPHEQARRNVADLLERDFGRSPTRAFFHTPIPQRRSTMFELEGRYPEEFARTWNSQFRNVEDFEINSWLHHYYGYLKGYAVLGAIRYDYFSMDEPTATRRLSRRRRARDLDVFCVNDAEHASARVRAEMADQLAAYFPIASSFERNAVTSLPDQSRSSADAGREITVPIEEIGEQITRPAVGNRSSV
jgi:hypothetical protein